MIEQISCVHCGSAGVLVSYDDVFYTRRSQCSGWNKYQFVGISRKSAIEQWNAANKPTLANQPVRKSNKYLYRMDDKEYANTPQMAAIIGVSASYIRDRFHYYGVKEGAIKIQGHVIERKLK